MEAALEALKDVEERRNFKHAYSGGRKRMQTDEAKESYKQRSATIERVNADVRTHRTMDRMLVRGTGKVLCVALWNALALNLMRCFVLAPIS